jgi:hypothetical protein
MEVAAEAAPLPLAEEVKRGQKRALDVFYSTRRLQVPDFPDLCVHHTAGGGRAAAPRAAPRTNFLPPASRLPLTHTPSPSCRVSFPHLTFPPRPQSARARAVQGAG